MKFALLGKGISHSRSPAIYKKIIGPHIIYDLIDVEEASSLPTIKDLSQKYNGVNITAPYKTAYMRELIVSDPVAKDLGAINTIAFSKGKAYGMNSDLVAVRIIFKHLQNRYPGLHLIILGSGTMAKLSHLVAEEFSLSFYGLNRQTHPDLAKIDLRPFEKGSQNIVINACSRDFVFEGTQSHDNIFWDYNYSFLAHQNTLPFAVKEYHDGQEMLFLQAEAAKIFWLNNID